MSEKPKRIVFLRKETRILPNSEFSVGIEVLEKPQKELTAEILIEPDEKGLKTVFKMKQKTFEHQTGFLIVPLVVGYQLYYSRMPEEINKFFSLGWIPPEDFDGIVVSTVRSEEKLRVLLVDFLKDKKMKFTVIFRDERDNDLLIFENVIGFNDLFLKCLK